MNEAKQQLDAGNLKGAMESALNLVKSNPTDRAARTFLFELSCFSGDWERAERQLEVVGHQDTNAMIGSMIYRQNFKAERDRANFFANGLKPEFLMTPPAYVEDLLQANNRLREGNTAEARQILDDVEENRPAFACRVNDEEFSDFRDYNDQTMCVLEAFLKDQYVWLPLEQIQKIEFFAPKSLRDLYWIQAEIELANGTNGEMFVPALYSDSWKSDDDRVRLGRMTDWRDAGEELFIGEGTKLFWMDGKEKSILDIRTVEFKHESDES
jgi:type VI secretion system protein ImpE